MRRAALVLAVTALAAGALAGCAGTSPAADATPMFSWGPCSTHDECYQATFPMAKVVTAAADRETALDCVAANTAAATDLTAKMGDKPADVTAESTHGSCRAVFRIAADGSASGSVFQVK